MKNKNNTQAPQKFNPPSIHFDQDGKLCFVYDAAAWSNKNKRSSEKMEDGNA